MQRSLLLTNIADPALTLAAAKSYLKVMHNDDDDEIQALINEAYGKAEARTGRQLRSATATLKMSAFPANGGTLVLPRPPLVSVTSFKYYDTAGTQQTLTDYQSGTALIPGMLALAPQLSQWPATAKRIDAVEIVYQCGGVEPEQITSAIKLMLNLDYNDIEATKAIQIEKRTDSLLHGYTIRDPRLFGITM